MQFKTLAFLSILSILFFTGCDSKDKNEETNENTNQVKIENVNKKSDFQLKTIDNVIIDIKLENDKIIVTNYPNKIVLINFFATWCPPCKVEIPNLIKLKQDYKNELEIVSIVLEEMKTDEELTAFMKSYGVNYTVVNSPESFDLAKNLGGIKSIPTMYLVDRNGKIFQKYVGLVPNEMMEIDIKKVLEK